MNEDENQYVEVNYSQTSPDDLAEEMFLSRNFLATSRQFSHVSDWIMQLDDDTKNYILECAEKLAKDDNLDECDECEDLVLFGLYAMNKEFEDSMFNDEELTTALNCIVEFILISKGVKLGNIKIVNWGTKSIFDESMEFEIVNKDKK